MLWITSIYLLFFVWHWRTQRMTFKVCRLCWKEECSGADSQMWAAVAQIFPHPGKAWLFGFLVGKGIAFPGAGKMVFHIIHEGSPSFPIYRSRKTSGRLITVLILNIILCFICNLQSTIESPCAKWNPIWKLGYLLGASAILSFALKTFRKLFIPQAVSVIKTRGRVFSESGCSPVH